MSTWQCLSCGHQADFGEFNAGSVEVYDEELEETVEEDTTQCPQCGGDRAFEL